MKRIIITFSFLVWCLFSIAQSVQNKLGAAFQKFEQDSQLRNALSSLYVVETKTGKVLFEKNAGYGLAPASTQKIITSVTAYELLGPNFRYQTEIGYDGNISGGSLKGNLFINGSGDPTLGSWRWQATKRESVIGSIVAALKAKGIKQIDGDIYLDESRFSFQPTPDGWIWQDMGNYYGAGAWGLNWNENQYDLYLKPGEKIGDKTTIIKTDPELKTATLWNEIKTGPAGSGDNGYIYLAPYAQNGYTSGTIPLGVSSFKISGSMPYPSDCFASDIEAGLRKSGITFKGTFNLYKSKLQGEKKWPRQSTLLKTLESPALDSIIYWFNRKSINLYGEALLKTFSEQKKGHGSTEEGAALLKAFWKDKGVPVTELNIVDGSGLSPLNRVTTKAQVNILLYAKKQNWFSGFYQSLPEYNGMKMKSGTINGVKGFTGYHKSKEGVEYTFSFLVNNYNGSSGALVNKMYEVLDLLK